MRRTCTRLFGAGLGLAAMLATVLAMQAAQAGNERPLFITLGASARPPIGWIEFCAEHVRECETKALEARDVVLTPKAWNELVRINKWVNGNVKPMTDLDHWGVVE